MFIKPFLKLGYDLRPLKGKLGNQNFASVIRQGLCEVATYRLIRRARNGQDIIQYLPTTRFASVRVIKSPNAKKILERIIPDYKAFTDKIFFYDDLETLTNAFTVEKSHQDKTKMGNVYMKAWIDLRNDLTVKEPPHLVITVADETPLLTALDKAGLSYGKHVISLRQEYINHCEKIFHNLGK